MTKTRFGLCVCALFLLGSASALRAQCPPGLPPETTCHAGRDTNGAFFLIAVPANYNNILVLWNHGYDLNPPTPLSATSLGPPALLLGRGFAVAASSYRPDPVGLGGWAVADAAVDTENLRQQFIRIFDRPDLTFVVGASLGGIITAEMAELFGTDPDGNLNYDGVLPLCGPLAGGRRNWYGGFDLRVVYQYYCQNLPRPGELQYPLYLGVVPLTFSQPEVIARVNECTGVLQPPATRTPQQQHNLDNILGVTKTPESFLLTDMFFATFALGELVQVRTRGMNPVTNLGVAYTGSDDDDALNAGVFRAGSNPDALAFLISAYDPTGNVVMPAVTMHTIGDGLVIVENENAYAQTLKDAGTRKNLFRAFTNANGHCQFSASEFLAAFQALIDWVQNGSRPTKNKVIADCAEFAEQLGDTCDFNRHFRPADFSTRVPDREP